MSNTNEMLVLAEMMGVYKSGIHHGAVTYYPHKSQDKEKLFNPTTDELLEWLLTTDGYINYFCKDYIEFVFDHPYKNFESELDDIKQNILDIAIQVSQYIKMNGVEDE